MSLMLKKYKFTIFHLLRDKVPNALRLHFLYSPDANVNGSMSNYI